MTKTEFRTIAVDVFSEFLPKTKASDRNLVISELVLELEAQGLELEDDNDEDVESEDF